MKSTLGLLESCCNESLFNATELKKAEQGDHLRLVFAKPITVTVMREKVKVSELVLGLPLNTGVFWLRSGNKVMRYSKYEFQKEKPFVAWLREAQPANERHSRSFLGGRRFGVPPRPRAGEPHEDDRAASATRARVPREWV